MVRRLESTIKKVIPSSIKHNLILHDYILGYLGSPGANQSFKQAAVSNFISSSSGTISSIETKSAHRSSRSPGSPTTWGAATAVNHYTQNIVASMQLGGATTSEEQEQFNALSLMADYVLGANPMGMSWITGLGSKSPTNILWSDSIVFMNQKDLPTMPGIPVYGVGDLGGAVYYDYGLNTMYPKFINRPNLRKYADLRTFIQHNEFTVDSTQSPITQLFGILLNPNVHVPENWTPGESDHKNTLPLSYGYKYEGGVVLPEEDPTIDPPPEEDLFLNGSFGVIHNFEDKNMGWYENGYLWSWTWGPKSSKLRASSTLDVVQNTSKNNKILRVFVDDTLLSSGSMLVFNAGAKGVGNMLSPKADAVRVKLKVEQGSFGITFGSPTSQLGNSDVSLQKKFFINVISGSLPNECVSIKNKGEDGWIQCDFDLNNNLLVLWI